MRDFDQAPFLVIWEVTQACDLVCRHCRASAQPGRDPGELSTEEGIELLGQVKGFGDPLMVFTGGDPLKRPDLQTLLEASVALGLRTTVTPSATPLLTGEAITGFKRAGVARMAVSLDGPDAVTHDGFRGVDGSYARTLYALEEAKRVGLETQVNTTVTRHSRARRSEVAEIVAASGSKLWSVFFLIATGRAVTEDDLSAQEYEEVFEFLYQLSKRAPFDIKTTEAQHYRRYVAQRKKAEGGGSGDSKRSSSSIARQAGINDGKGFVFISHTGEIYPSRFLPLSAGNVRRDSLAEVYRQSPFFLQLRDTSQLGGKCGHCDYRNLCGGSRSRAYALTGDHMAEELRCVFEPGANVVGCGQME